MRLPQRPEQHVIEADAWRLLQSLAPREWIVREVTERDYGIDCYIELTSTAGEISGDLMSVQLKGVNEISWKPLKGSGHKARTPPIKTPTANYWLGLPVPVFVFVADLKVRNIYFSPGKEALRSRYFDLQKSKTISLGLVDELNLKSDAAKALLEWFYHRERDYDGFTFHLTNLLSQVHNIADFIQEYQNIDGFLEVDARPHLQFLALYRSCLMVSAYLGRDLRLEALVELYAKDKRELGQDHAYLHEGTLKYILQKLEKTFPALVRTCLALVTEHQRAYWVTRDPVFYALCSSGDVQNSLRSFEERFGVTGS